MSFNFSDLNAENERKKRVCAAIQIGICTNKVTGKHNHTYQHYLQCETCGINKKIVSTGRIMQYGICIPCAFNCHAGHKLKYGGYGNFVCDCSDFKKCKNPTGYIVSNETYKQRSKEIVKCMINRKCTREGTGKQFAYQHWFSCKTCGLVENKGVCLECVATCHKNHEIIPMRFGPFYCDCPDYHRNCIYSPRIQTNHTIISPPNYLNNTISSPPRTLHQNTTNQQNTNYSIRSSKEMKNLKDENKMLRKRLKDLETELNEEKKKTLRLLKMNSELSDTLCGNGKAKKVENIKEVDDTWNLQQLTDRKESNKTKIKGLQEENEKIDQIMMEKTVDERLCPICMEFPKNTVCIPCGHVFCEKCVQNFTQCPLDRKSIVSKTKIYL